MTDLNHLDELYGKSTKGPIGYAVDVRGQIEIAPWHEGSNGEYLDWGKEIALITSTESDAALIVSLINAWPSIRAELEAGRALAKRVEEMDFEDVDALETCSVPEMQDRVNAMRFGRNEQNAVWRAERDAALEAYNDSISKTE